MKSRKIILFIALLSMAIISSAQPLPYRNSLFLTVVLQTTQETINRMVPHPFIPNKEGILMFNMGELKIEGSFQYNELFIFIPVELNGRKGYFVPFLYMDNFRGVIYGREVWGFNKIMASFQSHKTETAITHTCFLSDQKLFEVEYTFGVPMPIPEVLNDLFYLWKRIPSVEGVSYDVDQINSVSFENSKINSWQQGEAKVSFYDVGGEDGMGDIPVLKVLEASYSNRDFNLPFGKVEINYLLKK